MESDKDEKEGFTGFVTKGSLLTDNNMLIDCNLVVEFLVVSVGRVRALR